MKPGDIALVRFPFTDLSATKKRPVLVLARTARAPRSRLTTIAMITSQIETLPLDGDVLLSDWKAAGLLRRSLARLAKIVTVEEDLVERRLGRLSARDRAAARPALRRVLSAWLA